MRIRHVFAAAALAAGIGGLIVPALAQMQDQAGGPPDGSVDQLDRGAGTDHRMMPRGGMARGMMSGNCAGMMQSMNGRDGRPNSQWRASPPNGSEPD